MAEAVTVAFIQTLLWRLFTLQRHLHDNADPFGRAFSFNQSALTSLPLTGLTLDWYRRLFANDSFWPALQNSLIVGFTVAVVSVFTGTLAALAPSRMRSGAAQP